MIETSELPVSLVDASVSMYLAIREIVMDPDQAGRLDAETIERLEDAMESARIAKVARLAGAE